MKIIIHAETIEANITNSRKSYVVTFATANKFNRLERFTIPADEQMFEDIRSGIVEFELEIRKKDAK